MKILCCIYRQRIFAQMNGKERKLRAYGGKAKAKSMQGLGKRR